jgi:hypothetical protein
MVKEILEDWWLYVELRSHGESGGEPFSFSGRVEGN